jgi:hypothetical protein
MPGNGVRLQASGAYVAFRLYAAIELFLIPYCLFTPAPWFAVIPIALLPTNLPILKRYVAIDDASLVVRNAFDTRSVTPNEATLKLDKFRLRVVFRNGKYDLVPGAVDLTTNMWWNSRPARRRTLLFLGAAQDAGFEVEVTKQPKWAHELAAQLGLNSQTD